MIKIDGSMGEGGGQILRSALTLSAITGKSFQIEKIRAGRKKTGLLRQHLTSVKAAVKICGGKVEGDEIGSTSLKFIPGKIKPGDYHFRIGTAGSTMLVLQTIILPLAMESEGSTIIIEGGTHNSMAPTFHYIKEVFLPLVKRIGFDISIQFLDYGFYPAGGGKIKVTTHPIEKLNRVNILERGEIDSIVITGI